MRMVRRGNLEVQTLPEPVPPAKLTHEIAAEEAARAAERYHKLVADNERLTNERDSWKRHADTCEAEIARFEAREQELTEKLTTTANELGRDRDLYRLRLVRLYAQFETAGSIVLKCIEAARSQAPEVDLREQAALDAHDEGHADQQQEQPAPEAHEATDEK